MTKTKYRLILIYENGEEYKIVGIKEGLLPIDYISKHDKILNLWYGTIEISGDLDKIKDYIEVDTDYSLTWDEQQEFEPWRNK